MTASIGPDSLNELAALLKNLPGVGKRSAERMALAIFRWNDDRLNALADNLANLHRRIHTCPICGNLSDAPENGLCTVCSMPGRDTSCICVVEDVTQIYSLEASGTFKGLYHVLGGRIAPLEGKNIDSLSIPQLEQRIQNGGVKELILALSRDLEGQATEVFLAESFARFHIRISRLAGGLPAGSDLSYADPATIAIALSGRTNVVS